METFRLWLERDPDIPRFEQLAYERARTTIADVLLKGVHPWQGPRAHPSLTEKFAELINSDTTKPAELAQFSYCGDVSDASPYYPYEMEKSPFEQLLERIRNGVRFVDRLTYGELLSIARERLRRAWSHTVAYELLRAARSDFGEMRDFLKAKDKTMKLSGYADIEHYDLGRILTLEDFEGEDTILVAHGIPVANFRSESFLSSVTDERGLLRLTSGIRHFQLIVHRGGAVPYTDTLVYNCHRDGHEIRLTPELNTDEAKRDRAKAYAAQWRKDSGRYCFTTDIARLGEMVGEERCQATFPSLRYIKPTEPSPSHAQIAPSKAPRFAVGPILTATVSGDRIKAVLKTHGVSMTGRKDELAEKLAKLSADEYAKRQAQLDRHFRRRRYIHIKNVSPTEANAFPLFRDRGAGEGDFADHNSGGADLSSMILTMYILKHLRANAILDGAYTNDTFDLLSLARALIQKQVTLQGAFMRVE